MEAVKKLSYGNLLNIHAKTHKFEPRISRPIRLRKDGLYVIVRNGYMHGVGDPLSQYDWTVGVKVKIPDTNPFRNTPKPGFKNMKEIGDFYQFNQSELTVDEVYNAVKRILYNLNCLQVFDVEYVLKESITAHKSGTSRYGGKYMEYNEPVQLERLNEAIEDHQEQMREYYDQILLDRIRTDNGSYIFTLNPDPNNSHWSRSGYLNTEHSGAEAAHTISISNDIDFATLSEDGNLLNVGVDWGNRDEIINRYAQGNFDHSAISGEPPITIEGLQEVAARMRDIPIREHRTIRPHELPDFINGITFIGTRPEDGHLLYSSTNGQYFSMDPRDGEITIENENE